MPSDRWLAASRLRKGGRIAWTIVSAVAVESVVFGVSVLPAVLLWQWALQRDVSPNMVRIVVLSMAVLPAYVVFALGLTIWSALAMRVVGWRTPANAEMRIADLDWPLLGWVRYLVSAHVVRLFAGSVFRATPVWTFYHRLNGAHMGRQVYINSLTVVDDNLLDFGEGGRRLGGSPLGAHGRRRRGQDCAGATRGQGDNRGRERHRCRGRDRSRHPSRGAQRGPETPAPRLRRGLRGRTRPAARCAND